MAEYTKHYVTNKLALYSHDLQTVMIMEYPPRHLWGLPGGHLDPNETPEEAMARELQEELGVTVEGIKKKDFFVRSFDEEDPSLVLAYVAIAPEGFKTNPSNYEAEHDIWVARDKIMDIPNIAGSYKQFILENWPQ